MSVFNSSGPYEFQGSVPPEDCDKLWLYVEADDGPGVHSRYLLDGCGEHTLNIDIANNIQVTGTVTLDGSPYVGQIGVAVGQMPPTLKPFEYGPQGQTWRVSTLFPRASTRRTATTFGCG